MSITINTRNEKTVHEIRDILHGLQKVSMPVSKSNHVLCIFRFQQCFLSIVDNSFAKLLFYKYILLQP